MFDVAVLLLVGYSCCWNIFYFAFPFDPGEALVIGNLIVEYIFVLDFFLNFFQGFRHPETYQNITDLKEIALRYFFGWFFIDLASIFPFQLFFKDDKSSKAVKLARLARLPRLGKLIDVSKIKKLLRSFGEQNNDKQILKQYLQLYAYKVFRLIILAFTITYFLGCTWFFISETEFADTCTMDMIDAGHKDCYIQEGTEHLPTPVVRYSNTWYR